MIQIRKLEQKDETFLNVLINSENSHYQEFLNMGWSLKQINNQFKKSTNLAYGIFYKELLISFILGDLINIEKILEYEILLIYVSKNFRKKGLGTKLLKKIEENNSNLKKIYLEVSEKNLQGILFYKKMGFKIVSTRKNYFLIRNKNINALVMIKNF